MDYARNEAFATLIRAVWLMFIGTIMIVTLATSQHGVILIIGCVITIPFALAGILGIGWSLWRLIVLSRQS